MWFGEYQRMQRAGKFLVDLERRINAEASKDLLSWETHLRTWHLHMKYPYNTTVMLLTAISVVSLITGVATLGIATNLMWLLIIAGTIIHLVIYMYTVSSMSKLQS